MWFGLRPLEFFYLLIGSAILGNEIFRTQSLTVTELGAALFFFGLTASSVADRTGERGPVDFIKEVVGLFKSLPAQPPPPEERERKKRRQEEGSEDR